MTGKELTNNDVAQNYKDEDAAKEVLASKLDLSPNINPFMKTFGVSINYDDYWNHPQMSVQFEHIHDIVYPNANIEYYFNHSSCHNKLREDGLNVNNMNKEYGGGQAHVQLHGLSLPLAETSYC